MNFNLQLETRIKNLLFGASFFIGTAVFRFPFFYEF